MFYRFALTIAFFYASSQVMFAQFQTTLVRDGKEFSFPIFSNRKATLASVKINRFLQLSELYFLPKPPYSKEIFGQSKANDGSIYGGKVSLVGTVHSNNSRALSLSFDVSACGATCGYWKSFYTFNSGNGDRINLKDLFTSNGYKVFFDSVLKRRTVKYRSEVRKKVQAQFRESYMDTLGCFEGDDLAGYYIRNDTVVIDGENCLIKGQKFDGLDMSISLTLPVFAKHLNEYGRVLFGIKTSDISKFRSRELPQLFEGSVGASNPIVMVLGREFENGFYGYYAYLKYGEGISIRGSEIGENIELTEYTLSRRISSGPLGEIRKAVQSGYITGQLKDLSFQGVWKDATKTKQLEFRALIP